MGPQQQLQCVNTLLSNQGKKTDFFKKAHLKKTIKPTKKKHFLFFL